MTFLSDTKHLIEDTKHLIEQLVALKPKRIGLALSGGAARGIAHIGVIKGLNELGIKIGCIAGTSSGSLIGGVYATGIDIEDMEKAVTKMRWLDIAGFRFSRTGIVSSKKLDKYLSRLIGQTHFEDLEIPFTALSTDILTGEPVELNDPEMCLTTAIRASSSFPGVYPPLPLDGKMLIDGGASANLPVDTVRNMGADFVIGIDVVPDVVIDDVPKNMALIVDRGLDLLLRRQRQNHKADLLLQPVHQPISSFDIKKAGRLIELGYQCVQYNRSILEKLV